MTFTKRCHSRLADGSHKTDDFCDIVERSNEYVISVIKQTYKDEGQEAVRVLLEEV